MLGARFAGNDKIARAQARGRGDDAGGLDRRHRHAFGRAISRARQEFDALLKLFRRLLKPGGLLVLGDVIPRKLSTLADAATLLRFGRQEGFFCAALRGLIRTYFSDYRRLRNSLGLTRYDAAEIDGQARSRRAFRRNPPAQTSATMTGE